MARPVATRVSGKRASRHVNAIGMVCGTLVSAGRKAQSRGACSSISTSISFGEWTLTIRHVQSSRSRSVVASNLRPDCSQAAITASTSLTPSCQVRPDAAGSVPDGG